MKTSYVECSLGIITSENKRRNYQKNYKEE